MENFNPLWLDFCNYYEGYIVAFIEGMKTEPHMYEDAEGNVLGLSEGCPDIAVEVWFDYIEDAGLEQAEPGMKRGSRLANNMPFTFPNNKTYYFHPMIESPWQDLEQFCKFFEDDYGNPEKIYANVLEFLLEKTWMTEEPI